ncbi:hypothetical protein BLS_000197 [Venturia inaequalis]|uniref:Tat pathway signal sequence n=1 Tax=Venturia inaequalis TaxID=5025 RepID=A0A8H3V0N3_VENIN|nr:hypothetical protein BLS_000197 [Venturia inaequalis]
MAFLSRGWSKDPPDLSPPKRISTPAGMRLSVIMENGGNFHGRTMRNSIFSSKGSSQTLITSPRKDSAAISEDLATSGYSYNIFAEKHPPSSQQTNQAGGFFQRRGGWKRILILFVVLLICIIAIAVGLAVGLKQSKKANSDDSSHSASTTQDTSSHQSASSSNPSASGVSAGGSISGTSVGASSPTSTARSKNFPIGSYSFITFLGNVDPSCTSNSLTWSCFPYSTFNDSPTKALTTFNWVISAGSTPGTYQISSSSNPFAITFSNRPLKLMNQGKADELYTFQFQTQKEVIPSGSITDDGTTAKCVYYDTTFTGYLYTKQAKEYPTTATGDGSPAFQPWPFAIRAEQIAGAGDDSPTCYSYKNGIQGDKIQGNFTVSDTQMLCDCIYRNWSPK